MEKVEDLFDGQEDPQRGDGLHNSLHGILVIALCALLFGVEKPLVGVRVRADQDLGRQRREAVDGDGRIQ